MSRSVLRNHLEETETNHSIQTQTQQGEVRQQNGAQQNMAPVTEETSLTDSVEEQQNQALNEELHSQYPPAQATGTTDSIPVQDDQPASMTFKQRRQETKKARAAREASPVGSAASYDMVAALRTRDAEKTNSAARHKELVDKSGVDGRILKAFSIGYQEKGVINKRPATQKDKENKEADDQFYKDYCSKDANRRKPHLERMVNEMINIRFTPQMLTERYLRTNMRQIAEISYKMLCLNNVMTDTVNASFFEKLDPYRKEALERSFQIFVPFHDALVKTLQKQGVDLNLRRGGYIGENYRELIEDGEQNADSAVQTFQEAIGEYERTMADLKEEQKQRVRISAASYAARLNAGSALMNRMKPRLELQEGEGTGPLLRQAHVFLRMEEGAEEQNLATAKTLLEIDRLKERNPSVDLYNRAYDLAKPRVERIMACDVDDLAFLTDEALMVRNEELNGLFMDSLALDDLMKIKHPDAGAGDSGLTLRDNLVLCRKEEYSYKTTMLKGLHERARALAIRRSLENGDRPQDMFSRGERFRGQAGKPIEWVQTHLEEGNRLIETACRDRIDIKKLGVREYQSWLVQKNSDVDKEVNLYRAALPLVREMDKMLEGNSAEAVNLCHRLRDHNYYSLKYSEKELKELKLPENEEQNQQGQNQEKKGYPNDIGEPLFRGFGAFMGMEAAQKLLTPEKAREMLRNLGAGAGMHKGGQWEEPVRNEEGQFQYIEQSRRFLWTKMKEKPDEEKRKEALEKNNRGLAVHREIYRAQCDMFARKYGNGWLNLSLEDFVAHQAEITMDFQESQVMLSMSTRYPEYFDENDPEDLLLRNRLAYYDYVGVRLSSAVSWLLSFIRSSNPFESEQQMRDELKNYLLLELIPETKKAGEWLLANDSAFGHSVDWSQTVRVPAENAE